MRRRLRIALFIVLLLVFLGALAYGIYQGDALLVKDNAAAFCFT